MSRDKIFRATNRHGAVFDVPMAISEDMAGNGDVRHSLHTASLPVRKGPHYRPETTEMGGQRDHKGQSQGIVGNNLEPADDKSDWGHGVTRIRFQGNSTPRVRIGKGNNEEAQLCWRGG